MKTIKKNFKNPISRALADYREDFNYNWDWYAKNLNKFNEYLLVQFKDGDCCCINDEDWFKENTSLPRFNASNILYISRFFGCGCERLTARDIELDTDLVRVFDSKGTTTRLIKLTEEEKNKMMREMDDYLSANDGTDGSLFCLDYCRNLVAKYNQH